MQQRWWAPVVLAIASLLVATSVAAQGRLPLEDFLKPADYSNLSLSPDGSMLAAVAPVNDRRNLILIDLKNRKARALTTFKDTDVASYEWVGEHLLEVRAADLGQANGQIFLKARVLLDTDANVIRSLYGSRMEIIQVAKSGDDGLVVVDNDRTRESLDAYRYNARSNRRELLTFQTPGEVAEYLADHAGQVRFAVSFPKNSQKRVLYYRSNNGTPWRKLREEDIDAPGIEPVLFSDDDKHVYVYASGGQTADDASGRRGVYEFDPEANALGQMVFLGPQVDAGNLVYDHINDKLVGVSDGSRSGVKWLDPQWEAIQKQVNEALPNTRNTLSWARYSMDRVLVTAGSDIQPPEYFLLDRKTFKMERLVASRSWINPAQMSHRTFIRYKARDGLSIPAYLTIPRFSEGRNLPLIVDIHGGPFVAGYGPGFNADAQFFASRGYAVLQPDFRGTSGYGTAFAHAGWRQWGGAMQDDVTDGVKEMIARGIVDPDRVCLFGGSYGGYATLYGLIKEPKMFRCGIAFVAVSDLELMFDVTWSDFMSTERNVDATLNLTRTIGDPVADREKLRAVSPLYQAERLQAPILLAYGGSDQRVPLVHGEKFRAALDKYGKSYEWVVYPDEAHGFNRMDNKLDFYKRIEAFLDKNLAPRK